MVFAALRSDQAAGAVKVAPAGVARFVSEASCSVDCAAKRMLAATTHAVNFRELQETRPVMVNYLRREYNASFSGQFDGNAARGTTVPEPQVPYSHIVLYGLMVT